MSIAIHRQSAGFKLVWMTEKTKVQTRINVCLLSSSHHTPLWKARLLSPWWHPHWQQSSCEVPPNLSHSTLVKPHCSGHFSRATAPALNLLQFINVFPVLEGGNTGHSTYMWSSEHWDGDNHCPWCPGCAPADAALDVVGHFCCQGMLVYCAHVMVWNRKHSTETSFQLFWNGRSCKWVLYGSLLGLMHVPGEGVKEVSAKIRVFGSYYAIHENENEGILWRRMYIWRKNPSYVHI